jgi:hypothetical protein
MGNNSCSIQPLIPTVSVGMYPWALCASQETQSAGTSKDLQLKLQPFAAAGLASYPLINMLFRPNGSAGVTPPNGVSATPSPAATDPKPFNMSKGSFLGHLAITLGIDAGIRYFFPDLPKNLNFPLNLGALWGVNDILSRLGIVDKIDWKAAAQAAPFAFVLSTLSAIGLDRIGAVFGVKGLQFGHWGNSVGTMVLSSGAIYGIQSSSRLAPLLTGGPGVVGNIGKVGRLAGIVGLMNFGLGVATSVQSLVKRNDPNFLLRTKVLDVMTLNAFKDSYGEYWGSVADGGLGKILLAVFGGCSFFSKTLEERIDHKRSIIRDQLIHDSWKLGAWAREELRKIFTETIAKTGTLDWNIIESEIKKLYQDPKNRKEQNIEKVYEYIEYVGFIQKKAQQIKDLIGLDGSIKSIDRNGLRMLVQKEIKEFFEYKHHQWREKAESEGLLNNDDENAPKPSQELNELAKEVGGLGKVLEVLESEK